jgi:ribosomal protein L19
MSTIIDSIEQRQLKRVPRFSPGDRVRGSLSRSVEGDTPATQVLRGRCDRP